MEETIKGILVNYTQECVDDILRSRILDCCPKHKLKKAIFDYLRNKFSIKGCPTRGQRNYWVLRGFSNESASQLFKNYSSVYAANSIEAIEKKFNVSTEKASAILKARVEKQKSSIQSKPKEERDAYNKKKGINSLNNCIRLYGEIDGPKIYNERRVKASSYVSKDGFISRYGEVEGLARYQDFLHKNSKNNRLEGFIERYGDELGRIKFNAVSDKKSKAQTLNGYIERYGEEIGFKKYLIRQQRYLKTYYSKSPNELDVIHKSKGKSHEYFIAKYGVDRADAIRRSKYVKFGRASKESLKVFLPFYKYLRRNGILRNDIYFGISGSSEYYLSNNNNFFLYDFTIKNKKFIVEFHGTAFHPKCADDKNWKSVFGDESASVVYARDLLKKQCAENAGFTYIEIWSDEDYKTNLNKIIYEYETNKNNV